MAWRPWRSNLLQYFRAGACMVLVILCVAAQANGAATRAMIAPSVARLRPGDTQSFKITLLATWKWHATVPANVSWSVDDIPGGNAEVGTIDAKGMYRAPAKPPKTHEVHIGAEVEGAANRYLWATVLIGAQPTYKRIGGWSESTESGRLKAPHGLSIDHNGNLLIADQGADRVFRYTKDGKFLGEVGLGPSKESHFSGKEPAHFTDPRFAIEDPSGNTFVEDVKSDTPRIHVFDGRGRLLRVFAEKGTRPGDILRPHGAAFDKQQRLFVPDPDNARVSIFDSSGKFVTSWDKGGIYPGEFSLPHGIFIDRNDDVFVNSFYGPTQKFTPDGHFLFAFAPGDPANDVTVFHSLSGDRWGNVYLTVEQKKGGLIAKYNNNGDFICNLHMSAPDYKPSWTAIDKDGTVYVLYKAKAEKKAGIEVFAEE